MKKDLDHISNLLRAYFDGTLSQSEKDELDRLLEHDPEAQLKFSDEIAVRSLMLESDIMDIRNQMTSDLKQIPSQASSINVWAWGGAIFIILVGVTLWFSQKEQLNKNVVVFENDTSSVISKYDTTEKNDYKSEVDNDILPKKENGIVENKNIDLSVNNIHKNTDVDEVENVNGNTIILEKTVLKGNKKETIENENNLENNETSNEFVDCSKFYPQYSISVTKAQKNSNNGQIKVTTKHTDLLFALDENGRFSSSVQFSNLGADRYILYIKNNDECIAKSDTILVEESLCEDNIQDLFSPENGEQWTIDFAAHCEQIKIVSKMQQIIFEQFNMDNNQFTWSGLDSNGNNVPKGLYKVIIVYENKETCIYSVTLIR